MSMHVTRGDFVLDYVPAQPRPRVLPGKTLMSAILAILLLALVAAAHGRDAAVEPQVDATDVLMQGP